MKKPNRLAGKLIYALSDDIGTRIFKVRGVDKSPVYSICHEGVSAIVSDIHTPRVRPERRNLMTHQSVLKTVGELDINILPMRFGVIAQNAKRVMEMLSRNRESILEQTERVAGKVEMGLRLKWDVDNIYEFFVTTHPELRDARDEMVNSSMNDSRDLQIQLGRMFDRILQEERETHAARVEEVFEGVCHEIRMNDPKGEEELLNLACLLPSGEVKRFEKAVFEASKLFDNSFLFDYSGPWAPHNFVDLNLAQGSQKDNKQTA